jgi:hypothetical protein
MMRKKVAAPEEKDPDELFDEMRIVRGLELPTPLADDERTQLRERFVQTREQESLMRLASGQTTSWDQLDPALRQQRNRELFDRLEQERFSALERFRNYQEALSPFAPMSEESRSFLIKPERVALLQRLLRRLRGRGNSQAQR